MKKVHMAHYNPKHGIVAKCGANFSQRYALEKKYVTCARCLLKLKKGKK